MAAALAANSRSEMVNPPTRVTLKVSVAMPASASDSAAPLGLLGRECAITWPGARDRVGARPAASRSGAATPLSPTTSPAIAGIVLARRPATPGPAAPSALGRVERGPVAPDGEQVVARPVGEQQVPVAEDDREPRAV